MKNLNLNIRDLIFSSKCSLCGERHCDKEPYLCYNCYRKISEKIGLKRRKNIYYAAYYDRDMRKLIASFKLKNRRYLGDLIGRLIREKLTEVIKIEDGKIGLSIKKVDPDFAKKKGLDPDKK